MSWPFSTPASPPTSFGGPGATVPTTPTEIGGGVSVTILGMHFVNTQSLGGTDHVVTVTDSAGHIIWQENVPAGSGSKPYDPTFEPMTGIKWSVDNGSDVVGHVWGY